MKTKLILIGGVPGTGKTTLAYDLALYYKIDKVISLDLIKAFAKTYHISSNKYLYTTTHEAYKLDDMSVIDGYLEHSRIVNAILLEILGNIKDNFVIIEGSTINKDLIDRIDKDKYQVFYFNLTLSSKDLIDRYKQKEKIRKSNWIRNIAIINEINKYLCEDNFNIVNDDLDETKEKIKNYVKKNICMQ